MPTPMLEQLLKRRSVKPALMREPGPSAEQLEAILTVGARVPDHKKLVPWRFVVFQGEGRARFGEALAAACAAEEVAPSSVRLETERNRFLDTPVVVGVISRTVSNPGAPEWEQILSCGAACHNIGLAANAQGFVSNWLTGWYSYSPSVHRHLGLADNERMAGFIYIGSASEIPPDRERPALVDVVTWY